MTARLAQAYIEGFQGAELGPHSVACMTKHFPGGGPQKDGLDPHFEFQQGQIYPGNNFAYHLIPFEAAIDAKTAAIIPYYGIPVDQTDENVAMSFNKTIITTLLRQHYGYDGVVCTDWGLITDAHMGGTVWPARAWGVEHLSRAARVRKALDAGVDQFGGESCADLVVELVQTGRLDEEQVAHILGDQAAAAAGAASQRRAMTLLKNENKILPIQGRPRLFVKDIDPAVAEGYAEVVTAPQDADLAIIRLQTPWVPVETQNPFARGFHHGDLDFKGEAKAEILTLLKTVPTVGVLYLDRPAVIPEISAQARALLGDYGASDAAVLDVIFGKARPEGKLPFELPSSMEAVRNQKADLPHDSEHPLYPFGFGLSY